MPVVSSAERAQRFAQAASALADEASRIVLSRLGECHDADVARRAAANAREAVALLAGLAQDDDATLDETIQAATWAMSSAAIALTQIKIDHPSAPRLEERAAP